jgi:hypothetical protein
MKLTPIDLAKEPMRFAVETDNYDFSSQRRTTINAPLTITMNATKTHNTAGKPVDSDHDK